MQNKSLNPADSCVQMQRSRSQPACAAHSPTEMSVHFIPSEAGISEAFRESSSLHRCPLRGVRWPFQLISPGKHDRISLKFRKWPLLMRFKKQDKTKQQKNSQANMIVLRSWSWTKYILCLNIKLQHCSQALNLEKGTREHERKRSTFLGFSLSAVETTAFEKQQVSFDELKISGPPACDFPGGTWPWKCSQENVNPCKYIWQADWSLQKLKE